MSNSPSKGTSHPGYTGFSLDRSTPSLWRVTFDNPPINLIDPVMIIALHDLLAEIEQDNRVAVVVFDSADAVRSFARTWTTDLKARRIRVNAVSPGSTDTSGLSDLLASGEAGQERLKMISNTVPLGRLGRPDEIAKAVVFLASDDSSYITGTELFVDGGFAQV